MGTQATITGITLTNNAVNGQFAPGGINGTGTLTQGPNSNLAVFNNGISVGTFNATSTGNTVTMRGTIPSTTYYNLTLNSNATLGGPITINGDLNIPVNESLDNVGYPINLKGNWINSGGTFIPENGTVNFIGTSTQTITGANTWYGLNIQATSTRTVYFQSGVAQTIASGGNLTLAGRLSNLLYLAPTVSATPWLLQASTTGVTQSVSYVSSSYSNAGPAGTYAMIKAYNGTNTDGGGNTNWNFTGALSLSISNTSIGFGSLSSSFAKYATTNLIGSTTPVFAHTISAAATSPSGYTLTVQGSTPKFGASTLTAIGGTNTPSSPGTSQFGLMATASGGSGSVSSPYTGSGYAYNSTATSSSVLASELAGDGITTVYSLQYLANISTATGAGNYSTALTYVMTVNY